MSINITEALGRLECAVKFLARNVDGDTPSAWGTAAEQVQNALDQPTDSSSIRLAERRNFAQLLAAI